MTQVVFQSAEEAIKTSIASANAKFVESVDVVINFNFKGIKVKTKIIIRGNVVLPHGDGKKRVIAVFAEGADKEAAIAAGADIVGLEDLIEQILQNSVKFDICLATPSVITKMAKVAKILGPKNLMPTAKSGTVTTNIGDAVTKFRKGVAIFKSDGSVLHLKIGNASMPVEDLVQNFDEAIHSISQSSEAAIASALSGKKGSKGKGGATISEIFVNSTMGKAHKVAINMKRSA